MQRQQHRSAASNLKVIVIILICLVVFGLLAVAACAGFGLWAFKNVSREVESAQAAADGFLDQLKAGQVQAAYQSTSADFQAQQTLPQFTAFVALHPNLSTHTSRNTAGFNMSAVGNVKSSVLPYTLNGPTGATNCTVTVMDDGNGWKVHRLTVP